ncbi:hypothetical protein [Agreia bicolorata]|uniref:hypothetical protein n=1 Tax=Agreia bicolorata TaxID=110935 RepID=UPI000697CBF9|nr:hypothetical protein [Agreia bicolorata]
MGDSVAKGASIRDSSPGAVPRFPSYFGSAHLKLEEIGDGRHWMTGPLEAQFGRGINFQISVPDAESLSRSLPSVGIGFFLSLETKWYRAGDEEAGVQQFLVTDPDGYLVRFQMSLGRRPAAQA